MRLLRAHIENFKLLEDVRLDFSTDPDRPLTVIRAENGSGKTSTLYALLWVLYGASGLPENARSLRLTSTAVPIGEQVSVSVMLEFEHTDENVYRSQYRLIRSVIETPVDNERVDRQGERVRLLKITNAGETELESGEAVIGKLVPLRLKDVFFTNGDAVQAFISGSVSSQQRQDQVHKAIKQLLGLDSLRVAQGDIDAAYKKLRGEAAKAVGSDTAKMEQDLEATDAGLGNIEANIESLAKWTPWFSRSRHGSVNCPHSGALGDLDKINERLKVWA